MGCSIRTRARSFLLPNSLQMMCQPGQDPDGRPSAASLRDHPRRSVNTVELAKRLLHVKQLRCFKQARPTGRKKVEHAFCRLAKHSVVSRCTVLAGSRGTRAACVQGSAASTQSSYSAAQLLRALRPAKTSAQTVCPVTFLLLGL